MASDDLDQLLDELTDDQLLKKLNATLDRRRNSNGVQRGRDMHASMHGRKPAKRNDR